MTTATAHIKVTSVVSLFILIVQMQSVTCDDISNNTTSNSSSWNKYLNPFKVIVPVHDLYNKGWLYRIFSDDEVPLTYPTETLIRAASHRKFKKMFYKMLTKEEVRKVTSTLQVLSIITYTKRKQNL